MTFINRHSVMSFSVHVLFLLMMMLARVETPSPFTEHSPVLHAYPVHETRIEKKSPHVAAKKETHSVLKKPSGVKTHSASIELISILHARIQAEQVYPVSSQALHEEDVVTVSFVLTPFGQVEQLELKRASSFSQLNEAALLAVRQAAPFVEAKQFLREKERFSVDIEFKIG